MYFGTIAHYRVKPGHEDALMAEMKTFETSPPPGWIYTTVFRAAEGADELLMSTVFESEEAYRRNADSPAMGERFQAMRQHLAADPEWHDGHVIHEAMRQG